MSAPAPVKRITTTSHAKVALPAMPAMPKLDSAVTPLAMAGMGAGGGSGGGGGSPSLFGFRENRANNALMGTFYDLKQSHGGQPTNIIGGPDGSAPQEKPANDINRKTVGSIRPRTMPKSNHPQPA